MGVELSTIDDRVRSMIAYAGPLVGVVSSRVGHDAHRQRRMSRQIGASLQRIRHAGETLLIADDTAIDPWVSHAAEVFSVPNLRIPKTENRDRLLIALADRIDAVHVRRGGKVTSLLRQRAGLQSGIVRVAIDACGSAHEVVWDLLCAGVVGCYLPAEPEPAVGDADPGGQLNVVNDIDWSSYLVHCTRATGGPWPTQSWDQYRDDLLLADSQSAARDCIDTLCRIVQKQRLIAGAISSCRSAPVVCFSAVPLPELLARRAYRSHLHRWDYEPFGIAIKRQAALRLGMQPVIYGDRETQRELPGDQKYRFQGRGATHDWTAEQEWRSSADVDLARLGRSEVVIFVPDQTAAARIAVWNRNRWRIAVLTNRADTTTTASPSPS